jgi:Family of unknown function (DUF6527)
MDRVTEVDVEFVDSAPAELILGTIYVSTKYRAIVHLCLCGCGEKVLLNLDPDAWSFTFDGRSISIHDSVGNVGLPCCSHYFVRRNRVDWLPPLSGIDPHLALAEPEPPKVEPQPVAKAGWFSRWFKRDR